MAILKKRTSSKQLPEARGLDRAPLGSIIRNFDEEFSISGGRAPSITSTGGSGGSNTITSSGGSGAGAITPNTSTKNPALTSTTKPVTTKPVVTTKPAVTTKPTTTKPTITTKPTTTTKPSVTTKTPTTPATKTTSPTSVVKPVVTKPNTNTSSATNKVVNALTGALLGAGTKLIIDKITGKPVVAPKTPPAGGSKTPPAGGSKTPPAGGSKTPPAGGAKTPPAGGSKTPPTSVVKPPLSDGSATDLYKGTPADPSLGLPSGAIDNGDGTYTTIFDDGSSITYSMEDDSVLYSTDTDGKIDVFEKSTDTSVAGGGGDDGEAGVVDDTVVAGDDTAPEYYQDDDGNYYTMNANGEYDLAYYADGSEYVAENDDTAVADNTWTDPDTGEVWTLGDGGSWSLEGDGAVDDSLYADNTYEDPDTGEMWTLAEDGTWSQEGEDVTYDDSLYADDTDYTDYIMADDSGYADEYDYYDYGDSEYAKRGGLITMMKKGGVPRFAPGGGATYSDLDYQAETFPITMNRYGDQSTANDSTVFDVNNDNSAYYTSVNNDDSAYYTSSDDNSAYDTFKPTAIEYGAFGEAPTDVRRSVLSSESATPDYVTELPNYAQEGDAAYGYRYFSDGTVIAPNGDYYQDDKLVWSKSASSPGGGDRPWYDLENIGSKLSKGFQDLTGVSDDTLKTITGALPAAGAGALVASLLGGDFDGGGTGNQNQGLDMSQVGLINPRTTDFGIGPTRFVGYDEYGTDDEGYVPNEELLRNLNAPGFNPVREGDYGYEDAPAEETPAVPAMASGGLSAMSTPVASYYTFGQPADILANLGMRPQPPMNPPQMTPQFGQKQPPQQGQQQGMPQQGMPQQMPPQMPQQAPQGMPQQGMPPQMRKGGLPHISNVPMTQGRMDFRRGSAVHGAGDGQSDDIPAMLADGEYVIDAETVAQIGNGSTKAGAQALDKFREGIRAHKRSAPVNKIPPKTKALTSYLKGAK